MQTFLLFDRVLKTENVNKGMEACREASSQSKRRRVLHFDDESLDVDVVTLCDETFSSSFLKSKVGIRAAICFCNFLFLLFYFVRDIL